MEEQIVTSQEELDNIPVDYHGRIIIKFGSPACPAIVGNRFANSTVTARGNSTVTARGNSTVTARGNSTVTARGNSTVEAFENSTVEACGDSTVTARGNSTVTAWGNSTVTARGNAQIVNRESDASRLSVSGNARIVYDPQTIEELIIFTGDVEHTETTVRLYKAVHKRDGRYYSDKDGSFEYVIGGEAVADGLTEDPEDVCGHGIHMADRDWCVEFGKNWGDLAILEVEADKAGIVVPKCGSGKVRARSVRVIREVPLEECGVLGKIIARRRQHEAG